MSYSKERKVKGKRHQGHRSRRDDKFFRSMGIKGVSAATSKSTRKKSNHANWKKRRRDVEMENLMGGEAKKGEMSEEQRLALRKEEDRNDWERLVVISEMVALPKHDPILFDLLSGEFEKIYPLDQDLVALADFVAREGVAGLDLDENQIMALLPDHPLVQLKRAVLVEEEEVSDDDGKKAKPTQAETEIKTAKSVPSSDGDAFSLDDLLASTAGFLDTQKPQKATVVPVVSKTPTATPDFSLDAILSNIPLTSSISSKKDPPPPSTKLASAELAELDFLCGL